MAPWQSSSDRDHHQFAHFLFHLRKNCPDLVVASWRYHEFWLESIVGTRDRWLVFSFRHEKRWRMRGNKKDESTNIIKYTNYIVVIIDGMKKKGRKGPQTGYIEIVKFTIYSHVPPHHWWSVKEFACSSKSVRSSGQLNVSMIAKRIGCLSYDLYPNHNPKIADAPIFMNGTL